MQKIKPPHREFLTRAASDRDLVPPVDPEHFNAAWCLYRESHKRYPGQPVFSRRGELEAVLPAGANVNAVAYRAVVLNMLHHVLSNYSIRADDAISHLRRFKDGDDFQRRVHTVMARIPLEWMQTGLVYTGWPFDVSEFIRQVEQEPA